MGDVGRVHAGPGTFQNDRERTIAPRIAALFEASSEPVETRLANFPRYVKRAHVTRFIALYEIFKRVLDIKGSIIECGVSGGFSLMTWAKLSAVLEPNNLTRRVYGFDTFSGLAAISPHDHSPDGMPERGDLAGLSHQELEQLIEVFDDDRFLGHIPKVELIHGDITDTVPEFVADRQHLVVSLLFLDCDLYEPTKVALEHFVPRMPRGAVVAFDELDNPIWPGETKALLDSVGVDGLRIERLSFDPYIGFAVL